MRTLIISDVHANLSALNAVLADAEPYDCVWCLGDLVGYGPDPNECINRIQAFPSLKCIKGNHDAAILGEIDIKAFNFEARASLAWLKSELTAENFRWLETLEERLVFEDFSIVHGSPRSPVWEYVMDLGTARDNMDEFDTQICLVGHTHLPGIYQLDADSPESPRLFRKVPGEHFTLDHKCIVNPGSVGQPRDHDPRASYLIFDDEANTWVYHRVAYNINNVQQRILSAGLPQRHAARLQQGW
jgi:predicted phosphodiesterase